MSDSRPVPLCPLGHGPLQLIYTDLPRASRHILTTDQSPVQVHHCTQCSVETIRPANPSPSKPDKP